MIIAFNFRNDVKCKNIANAIFYIFFAKIRHVVTKVAYTQTCTQRHTHKDTDMAVAIGEMTDFSKIIKKIIPCITVGRTVANVPSCNLSNRLGRESFEFEPHYCLYISHYIGHKVQ